MNLTLAITGASGTILRNKARVGVALIGIVCLAGPLAAQSSTARVFEGPSLFSPDYEPNDPFKHAHPPTNDELDALLRTREARDAADQLKKLNREQLRNIFSVVRIYIADLDEIDDLVLGSGPLSGADNDWFWIVRRAGGHAEVILFAHTLSLELLRKQTNGYRDVRTIWSSAAGYTLTDIYRYDGSRYTRMHEFTKTERVNQ
jgi:hypothetical protein